MTRFGEASGCDGEPFEADHRVATPIREPMIARDHGAGGDLLGSCALAVFGASNGPDEELIGREDQLGSDGIFRRGSGLLQELRAALLLNGEGVPRRDASNRRPIFGRSDQRDGLV